MYTNTMYINYTTPHIPSYLYNKVQSIICMGYHGNYMNGLPWKQYGIWKQ